jgi:hypothetical protein
MNFVLSPSRKLWSSPSSRLRTSSSFAIFHGFLGTSQNETQPVTTTVVLDSFSAYRPEETMTIIATY